MKLINIDLYRTVNILLYPIRVWTEFWSLNLPKSVRVLNQLSPGIKTTRCFYNSIIHWKLK